MFYQHVAEFHYVHHDIDGKSYADVAEKGSRLIAAAKSVGIGITSIPILYQRGGLGKPPNERQRRFISPSMDEYEKLVEASEHTYSYYDHADIGIGVHFMRAVDPTVIKD